MSSGSSFSDGDEEKDVLRPTKAKEKSKRKHSRSVLDEKH